LRSAQCLHDDLFSYIKELLEGNATADAISGSNVSCGDELMTRDAPAGRHRTWKSDVYAYVTPFIILVGIIGNSISLRVFCSPRMRKMSASIYLASLAISDTCVLLSYVLVHWLHRGMGRWPAGRSINLPALHPGRS